MESREEMVVELLDQVWQLQTRAEEDKTANLSLREDVEGRKMDVRQWRRRALSAEALLKKECEGRERGRSNKDGEM